MAKDSQAPEQAQVCDFRKVGGIDEARLARLGAAIEVFSRMFAQALESTLGLTCEVSLQSSKQVPCRAFLEKTGSSYLVSLQLGTLAECALLEIDSMLLFPVVDRLLGGSGGPSELSREVTDIEDQIAQDFVRLVCRELQNAWRAFNVPVSLGARQQAAQLQPTFSATDNALVFSFSVNMQSAGGGFQLVLPVATLGAFLGTNSSSIREFRKKGAMNPRLAERALAWTFEIELMVAGGKVRAADLLNLSVGKILQLGVPVRTPGVLRIGGHDAFAAVPVRSGNHRGAQLLDRLQENQTETENKP